MNMVPRSELNDMIDEGITIERQVQDRERLARLQQQRELAGPSSGNSSRDSGEMKESKQQDSLGLPIPQAQRDIGQQRERRPSIEMIITFNEENGSEHIGQSSEASKSRSVTPIGQPRSGVEAIEIEAPKEQSKTPEQQIGLQMGTESEPPTIPDKDQDESKRSESEPTMIIENIEKER